MINGTSPLAVASAYDRFADALLGATGSVIRNGQARCPAHEDSSPSLSVSPGDKGVKVHCHAGCRTEDVVAAVGLTMADLFDEARRPDASGRPQVVARYPYVDEAGEVLFHVERIEPGYDGKRKSFAQRPANGRKGPGAMRGVRFVIFRLPEVIEAVAAGDTVFVVEGEKDALALERAGYTATCNPAGAGKWRAEYNAAFANANVVIVRDRDKAGIAHAADVARHLGAVAKQVQVVEPATGKDVAEHLGAGLTVEQLPIVTDDAPEPSGSVDEWPTPTPLDASTELPEFPLDALPDWVAAHCRSVSTRLDVSPDLPAALALGCLSTALQRTWQVEVRPGWVEGVNLYLAAVLPPGEGKSPAEKATVGPLRRLEVELAEMAAPQIAEKVAAKKLLEKRAASLEKQYVDTGAPGAAEQAAKARAEAETAEIPGQPRLIAGDATPQAMVGLMANNGGAISLISTEAEVFSLMLGRFGDGSQLEAYLQGWSGDPIVVDRVGRAGERIDAAIITICCTVQPAVIDGFADHPELAGRGVTSRFMYALPTSRVGFRDVAGQILGDSDLSAEVEWADKVKKLARKAREATHPATLRFDQDAKVAYATWAADIEVRIRPTGDLRHMAEWTAKAKASVARVAGLLHLASGRTTTSEISAETVWAAIAIGDYWVEHARAVHARWSSSKATDRAKVVLDWVRRHRAAEVSVREVWRGVMRHQAFEALEELPDPLDDLVEHGYLRPLFDGPTVAGRRGVKGCSFAVHPSLVVATTKGAS